MQVAPHTLDPEQQLRLIHLLLGLRVEDKDVNVAAHASQGGGFVL
jgi:hypothetical protein